MINTQLTGKAVRMNVPSRPIKTKEEWKEAQEMAQEVVKFWDKENGSFSAGYEHGYAIHHAQVDADGKPYNFFVLDKDLTTEEASKKKRKKNDPTLKQMIKKRYFPAQVIYNPEIVTALQTFLDKLPMKNGKMHTVAAPNKMWYEEACMSFRHRKPKQVERFYKIKVKYEIVNKDGNRQTIEEWIEGLKSHIFQHEIDHANGISIAHGDADGKFPTIEEREIEEGFTRKEVERFTYEKIAEVERNVAEKGTCVLMCLEDDKYYRAPTTLKKLPEGFIEPDVIEFYNEDGTIKPPHDKAPMYTEAPKPEKKDGDKSEKTA